MVHVTLSAKQHLAWCMTTYAFGIIAMIGTSDQSCWLAEACKILLLLLQASCYRFAGI